MTSRLKIQSQGYQSRSQLDVEIEVAVEAGRLIRINCPRRSPWSMIAAEIRLERVQKQCSHSRSGCDCFVERAARLFFLGGNGRRAADPTFFYRPTGQAKFLSELKTDRNFSPFE